MTDPNLITHATPVVHHVYHVAHHVAKCVPQIQTVTQYVPTGVSYMTAIISTAVGVIVAGLIGYFVGKRGIPGTQKDLTNAATEVKKVSSEVSSAVQSVHP